MTNSFWRKKYRDKLDRKTTFIVKNGEILLEKLITNFNGKRNPISNFSSEELMQATNNYDPVNVMLDESYFRIYKGFLRGRHISVMTFKSNRKYASYDYCINNIVFGSQMCNKHILKLIGCCLETWIPILVFESLVKYGTLHDHIHCVHESHFESLSWRQSLKISMEIANVFAYLHAGFPRPIVYSGISLSKFFLDEHYIPKLFNFSYAECIPEGEIQIKDAQMRGAVGFVAPEHFKGVLYDKSDVYGFGVLLLDLLTGQRIGELAWRQGITNEDFESSSEMKEASNDEEDFESSSEMKEATKDEEDYESSSKMKDETETKDIEREFSIETKYEDCRFSSETNIDEEGEFSFEIKKRHCFWNRWKDIIENDKRHCFWNLWKEIIENDRIIDVVDPVILGDGLCPETQQQLKSFADLAIKCLSTSSEDRPTMIDAAKQLRKLQCSA